MQSEAVGAAEIPAIPRRAWYALLLTSFGQFFVIFDSTVLNVGFASIEKDFSDVARTTLAWALTSYSIGTASLLLLAGRVADLFGRKRVFLVGISIFAIGSLGAGLAPNVGILIATRAVQSVGGALMVPTSIALALPEFPPERRSLAVGVWGSIAALAGGLGPPLGAAVFTFADWRWIFFINLPIAAVGLFLVMRHVPQVAEQDVAPIDWPGVALTGLGLAALIFGFENLGRDALPPLLVAGLFATGLGLLWAYARYARGNPHAVLDTSLFRVGTFRASVVGGGFMRLAMGANPFLLALLFQVALGMNALQAGLLTFASAAGALVMKTVAPPILRRYGFRRVLTVNALIVGVSFMACASFTASTPHLAITAILLVGGFFRSLQFTSLNGLAYADIEADRMSRASTLSSMAQQLVQSIGIGLAATLLHFSMQAHGVKTLTVEVVAPIFLVIGAVTFISLAFYRRLPADAGDEMNGRA